jgi:lipopolysaccharide transport system ATP-binding protein
MSDIVIQVENLSKYYRLGLVGTTTLEDDLHRSWAKLRGKPDPTLKIGHDGKSNGDGYIWALKDIFFEVKQGEILGIIGRNGSGKSTLLKILSRVTAPTAGECRVKGRIASLLEVGTGFHPELTGRENIFLNGAILGMTKEEIRQKFDEIVAFAEVEKFIDTPVKRYSSGMYVRLAFAVAAHLEPEILFVDEVLAVGDAEFQKKCLGKLGDAAKEGRTVLFVSHNMAAIENLCGRCVLLQDGTVAGNGPTDQVIAQYLQTVTDSTSTTGGLAGRTDRTGSSAVVLTDFHLEDAKGNRVDTLQSGAGATLAFSILNRTGKPVRRIDLGFSIHDASGGQVFSILYSSYQNQEFELRYTNGCIRCRLPELPLAIGRYRIGARLTIQGVEADWPQEGVGWLDVVEGDFYGSGRKGFGNHAPLLLKGDWSLTEQIG